MILKPSKRFLGQILSYYFVLVDEHYQPIQECAGLINPTAWNSRVWRHRGKPLSIQRCTEGQWMMPPSPFTILQQCTRPRTCHWWGLIQPDLILRCGKIIIKHGLSPFYGKVTSLDIYQYSKYCALTEPDKFPFIKHKKTDTNRYSFRLEDLAKAFNCLDTPQTHDAKDDVLLTLSLTQALEATCSTSLQQFKAHQHNTDAFNAPYNIKNLYLRWSKLPTPPLSPPMNGW